MWSRTSCAVFMGRRTRVRPRTTPKVRELLKQTNPNWRSSSTRTWARLLADYRPSYNAEAAADARALHRPLRQEPPQEGPRSNVRSRRARAGPMRRAPASLVPLNQVNGSGEAHTTRRPAAWRSAHRREPGEDARAMARRPPSRAGLHGHGGPRGSPGVALWGMRGRGPEACRPHAGRSRATPYAPACGGNGGGNEPQQGFRTRSPARMDHSRRCASSTCSGPGASATLLRGHRLKASIPPYMKRYRRRHFGWEVWRASSSHQWSCPGFATNPRHLQSARCRRTSPRAPRREALQEPRESTLPSRPVSTTAEGSGRRGVLCSPPAGVLVSGMGGSGPDHPSQGDPMPLVNIRIYEG
jgi:hypothetical protein